MKDPLNQGYRITIKVEVDGNPFGEFRIFEEELTKEQMLTVVEDMMCNTLRDIGEKYEVNK